MSDQSTDQSDAKSGSKRSKILIVILAVLLAALAYDYLVARAAVESAYDKIAERSIEVNAIATEIFTDQDVQELLDRKPLRTFGDADGDRVEVYSWRGGLPFKTHDLFVVYRPSDGQQMFYRHAKFAYETSVDVSPNTVMRVVEQEEDAEFVDMSDEQFDEESDGSGSRGDGGAGGAESGERGGAGGGMDPAAMFEQRDNDGDGLLKDDEIPDRARQNMEEIDTDSDGAISKEEWAARIEARRAQRSGGGSRPEMELEDEATTEKPTAEESSPEEPTAEEPAAKETSADQPSSDNPDSDSPPPSQG